MAFDMLGNSTIISLPAAANHSANQYKLVTINSSGQAALTGAGAHVLGVLQNDPDAIGKSSTVALDGVSKVMAGAAIAIAANIASDASGKARTAVTSDFIIGIALEAAAADGDIISVALVNGGKL